jgi:voltage-gated potassium channel
MRVAVLVVATDFCAKLLASNDPLRVMRQPPSWVDLFILVSDDGE